MHRFQIGDAQLELTQGDITQMSADAIVNAANAALAGGGGVDGAIHRAGGPSIMAECRNIGGCATGSAVITGAGNLKARYVIHAVAPRYKGRPQDADLLRGAYAASLKLAEENGCETIAFPSLGTGAYAYPLKKASEIALRTVIDHARSGTQLRKVVFVLFSQADLETYEAKLNDIVAR